MRRVQEDVEKIGITAGASAVFRRTVPGTPNYSGVRSVRLSWDNFFKSDRVPPVIAEVVDVLNLCPWGGQDVGKMDLALKDDLARFVIR